MSTILAFAIASLCAADSNPKPVEIVAGGWIYPGSVHLQIPDERRHVILFFSTLQDSRQTLRYFEELRKIGEARDVAVLALSPESKKRVEKFAAKYKPRIPIGYGSRSYKDRRCKVERFPAVRVVDPQRPAMSEFEAIYSPAQLVAYAETLEPRTVLASGAFDASAPVERLEAHARGDADEMQRRRAVELLRARLPAAEFMALCDDLLESAEGVTLRGAIAYQRHLADPDAPEKEPLSPPSALARQARRESPDDPMWLDVSEYEAMAAELSPSELAADFLTFQEDALDPVNLLIRREIASRFNTISESGTAEEKAEARLQIMDIFPGEPDAAVRLWLVGALWSTTAPGDLEVADFLTEQLAAEPNIRSVRPMMETVIRCMRTGAGPCE